MINVVAGIIKNADNKILIAQRNLKKSQGGLWEFPGGKMEQGETKETAIVREIKEELKIDISPIRYVDEKAFEYSDKTINLIAIECKYESGTLIKTEHEQVAWVTPDEMKDYKFAPADEFILKYLAPNNELKIVEKYLKEDNNIFCFSNENIREIVYDFFDNIVPFEQPDLYTIVKNNLYVIEHFEFDGYKSNRFGSDYRIQESSILKGFSEKTKDPNRDEEVIQHNKIVSSSSKEKYIENFKKQFSNHYEKILNYKKRLEFKSENIKTCFFIEDVSPLGSNFIKNGRPNLLFAFSFNNIIDFLLNHLEVSLILYGYFDGNKKRLLLITNNKETWKSFKEQHELADDAECFWYSPEIVSFSKLVLKVDDE